MLGPEGVCIRKGMPIVKEDNFEKEVLFFLKVDLNFPVVSALLCLLLLRPSSLRKVAPLGTEMETTYISERLFVGRYAMPSPSYLQ